ncbi:hypothetical protein BD309DRAFT_957240, partial [Dichomitus squalens]
MHLCETCIEGNQLNILFIPNRAHPSQKPKECPHAPRASPATQVQWLRARNAHASHR